MENLAFAYKIAKNLKIKDQIIIEALNKFKGLPHRQEILFVNNKLTLIRYKDSIGVEHGIELTQI